jgi:hypothetical protein
MYANLLVLLTLLASSARALTCPQGAGTDTAGPSTLQAYDPVTGTVTPLFIYLYGADAPTGFSIITVRYISFTASPLDAHYLRVIAVVLFIVYLPHYIRG